MVYASQSDWCLIQPPQQRLVALDAVLFLQLYHLRQSRNQFIELPKIEDAFESNSFDDGIHQGRHPSLGLPASIRRSGSAEYNLGVLLHAQQQLFEHGLSNVVEVQIHSFGEYPFQDCADTFIRQGLLWVL